MSIFGLSRRGFLIVLASLTGCKKLQINEDERMQNFRPPAQDEEETIDDLIELGPGRIGFEYSIPGIASITAHSEVREMVHKGKPAYHIKFQFTSDIISQYPVDFWQDAILDENGVLVQADTYLEHWPGIMQRGQKVYVRQQVLQGQSYDREKSRLHVWEEMYTDGDLKKADEWLTPKTSPIILSHLIHMLLHPRTFEKIMKMLKAPGTQETPPVIRFPFYWDGMQSINFKIRNFNDVFTHEPTTDDPRERTAWYHHLVEQNIDPAECDILSVLGIPGQGLLHFVRPFDKLFISHIQLPAYFPNVVCTYDELGLSSLDADGLPALNRSY